MSVKIVEVVTPTRGAVISLKERGERGRTGKSPYDIAVENGFSGTETQWLASMKGDKGDPGISAAQIAKLDALPTVTVSDTAPSNPAVGDIWVDIS